MQFFKFALSLATLLVATTHANAQAEPENLITRKLQRFLDNSGLTTLEHNNPLEAKLVPARAGDVHQIREALRDMENLSDTLTRNAEPLDIFPFETFLLVWDELAKSQLQGELAKRVEEFKADPTNQAAELRARKIYAAHRVLRKDFAELSQVLDTSAKSNKKREKAEFWQISARIDEAEALLGHLDPAWEMAERAPAMLAKLRATRQELNTMNAFVEGEAHW